MQFFGRWLPAVVVWGLFGHLRQTGGLDWTPRWVDLYLLVVWLVLLPLCARLGLRLRSGDRQAKQAVYTQLQRHQRAYQDFVNATGNFASLVFEHGTTDALFGELARFALQLVVIGLAPLVAVGLWLLSKKA